MRLKYILRIRFYHNCGAMRLKYILRIRFYHNYGAMRLKYITGSHCYQYYSAMRLKYNAFCIQPHRGEIMVENRGPGFPKGA